MVGASSAPLDVEDVAVGKSMTGVTVMTSLAADAETLPSLLVTVNGIVTVPLKFAAGVKTSIAAWATVTGVPATTGAVPANHPIEQTDTGRIILLNLAAEDMCPVRAEVLKRTFIGNMAIERLVKSASPGDHQSMIFCVDDVSQCFGQSSAEYDLMLDHVKNLDGQVCLGHKNSDQLTSDLLRPDFRGLPIILAGNFGLDAKDEETASH